MGEEQGNSDMDKTKGKVFGDNSSTDLKTHDITVTF